MVVIHHQLGHTSNQKVFQQVTYMEIQLIVKLTQWPHVITMFQENTVHVQLLVQPQNVKLNVVTILITTVINQLTKVHQYMVYHQEFQLFKLN